MAKRFMYICLGILALVTTFHIGAKYGHAEYVDQSATGIVAHWQGSERFALLDNGEVWAFDQNPPCGWIREDIRYDPPIPPSQIKFISDWFVISDANEAWYYTSPTGWINYGAPPGGATLTQPTTWGKIKAEFGE